MLRRQLTFVAGQRAVQQEGERGLFLIGGEGGGCFYCCCCCCCCSAEGHLPDICNKESKCLVICFSPLKLIIKRSKKYSQLEQKVVADIYGKYFTLRIVNSQTKLKNLQVSIKNLLSLSHTRAENPYQVSTLKNMCLLLDCCYLH